MNIFIIFEQDFPLEFTRSFSFSSDANVLHKLDANNRVIDKDLIKKLEPFKLAFLRRFGTREWAITVDFKLNKDDTQPNWNVCLKGDILLALHHILCHGDDNESLEIAFEATRYRMDRWGSQTQTDTKINISGFIADIEVYPDIETHGCYFKKFVPVVVPPPASHDYRYQWKATIKVNGTDFVYLDSVLPKCLETNQTIFRDKRFCDLSLLCDDGTSIPCHRAFLCAKSSVLATNLKRNEMDGRENELKVLGMTAAGINALLAYIYCNDITTALKCSAITLELIIAADKYDILDLWKTTATILKEKSHSWFHIDDALTLFSFVSKCARDDCQALKQRMIIVLALKRNELIESELYKEMFPNPVSREMFELSLDRNVQ